MGLSAPTRATSKHFLACSDSPRLAVFVSSSRSSPSAANNSRLVGASSPIQSFRTYSPLSRRPRAREPPNASISTPPPPLPTAVTPDPAAPMVTVGAMPLTARLAPDGVHVVLSLSGYGKQGLRVVDRTTDVVHPVVEQTSAFVGLAFSPDGRTLYSSGGNQDVVYRYDWDPLGAHMRA